MRLRYASVIPLSLALLGGCGHHGKKAANKPDEPIRDEPTTPTPEEAARSAELAALERTYMTTLDVSELDRTAAQIAQRTSPEYVRQLSKKRLDATPSPDEPEHDRGHDSDHGASPPGAPEVRSCNDPSEGRRARTWFESSRRSLRRCGSIWPAGEAC